MQKNLYIRDSDIEVWEKVEELIDQPRSRFITDLLREFVHNRECLQVGTSKKKYQVTFQYIVEQTKEVIAYGDTEEERRSDALTKARIPQGGKTVYQKSMDVELIHIIPEDEKDNLPEDKQWHQGYGA